MDPNQLQLVLAILGASLGLSGLLLVFMGFLFSNGQSAGTVKKANLYKMVARVGTVPLLLSFIAAWLAVSFAMGSEVQLDSIVLAFRAAIATTFLYACVVLFRFQ